MSADCTCPLNPDCPVHEIWQMDRASIQRFATPEYATAITAEPDTLPDDDALRARVVQLEDALHRLIDELPFPPMEKVDWTRLREARDQARLLLSGSPQTSKGHQK